MLSNHVIEHVGDEAKQLHHLSELRRVLKDGGIDYLAVPNRWMIIEPHDHLAFLSWLPTACRSPYLRLMGQGDHYECRLLTLPQTETALQKSALGLENLSTQALRELIKIEGKEGLMIAAASRRSNRVLELIAPLNPTLIYRLWRLP